MSREIRFRAWNGAVGRMFPPLTLKELTEKAHLYDDMEHMQYTGLKDKNGVEIYEGDIVEWDTEACVVEWVYGAWRIKPSISWASEENAPIAQYLSEFDRSDVEVIGNIYENKELLNDTK